MISKAKINSETTQNLSPHQLDELVFEKGSQKASGIFGEYFENNPKDILLCQMYACFVVDFEVRNGGFDQFILNNEELIDFALEGLLKIGAAEHHKLLQSAKKIYFEQKEEYKTRNPNLDVLDEEYYNLNDLAQIRQKFIAENIRMFYD